nr:ATP-binding protein [Deinococcus aestuarii]
MLAAPDLFTLQGPPGAGKTTTITELILHEIARNPRVRILVTSQSRAAVSNVFTRLDELRRDRRVRLPRDFLTYRDDRTEAQSPEFTAWADGVRVRSRAAGHPALGEWRQQVKTQAVEDEYLRAVNVYGATLMRLPRLLRRLDDLDAFDLVIVDEAARATLPELLVAMLRGTRVILVGDHKQLPPHLEDLRREQLRDAGYDERDVKRSLFEELFTGVPGAARPGLPEALTHTLDTQYRMHPSIAAIVSRAFYGGRLATGPLRDRTLNADGLGGKARAFWLDLPGRAVKDGTSWRNPEQAQGARRLLERLDGDLARRRPPAQPLTVAVICAYRAHVREVRRTLQGLSLRHLEVVVNTVDAFQGQERDVIVYASGRPLTASPFVADPQRLNVAFSRAKRLLVVIGDREASLGSGQLRAVASLFPPLPAAYQQEVVRATPTRDRDDRQNEGPRTVLAVGGRRGAEPAGDAPAAGEGRPRRRGRRRPHGGRRPAGSGG